ncbi:MAG: cytochrome c family protein [Desulfobulbaceae bacterium]|nr:cytochrome c family protein [Desulfobulbaceae bacterium]
MQTVATAEEPTMQTLTHAPRPTLLLLTSFALLLAFTPGPVTAAPPTPTYVGCLACQSCHPEEFRRFVTYAKKSRSFESIERLRHSLTEAEIERCYGCHTTGYGKPGGFVSIEATPHLKNAGCEVCHGPGGRHAATSDPAAIKRHLTKEDCEVCHTTERVAAFRFKPLIHGGAH